MPFLKTTDYKGLTVENAIYTVESITIQGGQLDFFVSMRAKPESPILTGEYHGCVYDINNGTPESQAYSYLETLDFFKSATII